MYVVRGCFLTNVEALGPVFTEEYITEGLVGNLNHLGLNVESAKG